jgi:hypothetical protein
MTRVCAKIGLAALFALFATRASAVEGGFSPYPKGMSGFLAGVAPPPGIYLTDVYYYFNGSVGAEVRGGAAEFNVRTTLNADFLFGTDMTDLTIFGGRYGFGAAIAGLGIDLHATLSSALGGRDVDLGRSGLGDSLFEPAVLGWDDGNLHWSTAFLIYMPTGEYDKGQLSVGKNIWAFMPEFSMTYFDPKAGWDVSGTLVYVTMTKNEATEYQSGDILHLDWSAGKHFGAEGQWEVGVAGNIVQQISADGGTGAVLGPLKAESIGLGPSVSYSTKIGETPLSLSAKWEHDIDSHATIGGDVVDVSATVAF